MISNKTAFTGLFVLSTCLSGCASVDSVNSAINQISGGIFSVGSAPADSGPVVLSKGVPQASHKIAQEYRVPVDVDTAAARVKRYYGFISAEEVTQLRNNGTQSGSVMWLNKPDTKLTSIMEVFSEPETKIYR